MFEVVGSGPPGSSLCLLYMHVSTDFPGSLFVVHWSPDVLQWQISAGVIISRPHCRWWVSVGVVSRIHPWHYQMSQVHGCHVIVSWHRTKNITTVTHWNLVETILCAKMIYFGRFVRSRKLVVKVKSIKCIKKSLIILKCLRQIEY